MAVTAKDEEAIWKESAKGVQELAAKAIRNVDEMVDARDRLWEERTVSDVTSLEILRGQMALHRAREQVRGIAPAVLPVIVINNRIEEKKSWEAFAEQVNRDGKLIEADVVEPPEPKE